MFIQQTCDKHVFSGFDQVTPTATTHKHCRIFKSNIK